MDKRRKIVVVSTFSGMDLFLLGMVAAGMVPGYAIERNVYSALMHAANFKDDEGNAVIEFLEISKEEYDYRKSHLDDEGRKDLADTTTIRDGKYIRPKTIEEVSGYKVRKAIEKKYGKNVIIILVGGPPCQDLTKVNVTNKREGANNRTNLVFEFLRFLEQLCPDIAIMEESDMFQSPKYQGVFDSFVKQVKTLPYYFAHRLMNALNYSGRQHRIRCIFIFVHKRLNADPIFPEPHPDSNAKRAGDFLDITHFDSGEFSVSIKTKNSFMCTITRGTPRWFFKSEIRRSPTIEELLKCMGVDPGMYVIPPGIPIHQIKMAIGNGVCFELAFALGKGILNDILKLRPDGNGCHEVRRKQIISLK